MAAALPDWVMLDRYVTTIGAAAASSLPGKGYAPLRAQGTTSEPQAVPFILTLCLADPPAATRLYVEFPTVPSQGRTIGCELMAAHGNHLLLGISDVVKRFDPSDHRLLFQDHFICTVAAASPDQPPALLLKRLPVSTNRLSYVSLSDGSERTTRRMFYANSMGLLARPGRHEEEEEEEEEKEEEFAVAHLDRFTEVRGDNDSWILVAELSVLHTRVSSSSDDGAKWDVKRVPILDPRHIIASGIIRWTSQTVIPFKNYICFVDYEKGGILFFDVFEQSPKASYLELPSHGQSDQTHHHEGSLRFYCSVCVTGDGQSLKYVHVDREDGKRAGEIVESSSFRFAITSHVLKTTEGGEMLWVEEASVKSDRVWPSICPVSPCILPENVLAFPLVSMDFAHLVHFLFTENLDDGPTDKVSVVTIDMNAGEIVSIYPYITGDEDRCGYEADMLEEKHCNPRGFLPSKFPRRVVTRKRKIMSDDS